MSIPIGLTVNGAISASGVILGDGLFVSGQTIASIFGRTGIIIAQVGDYSAFYYPLNSNPTGFLSGITSAQVTTALGFTPSSGVTNPITNTAGVLGLAISPNANNKIQLFANGIFVGDFISGVTAPALSVNTGILTYNGLFISAVTAPGLSVVGGVLTNNNLFISGVTNPLQVLGGILSLKVSAVSGNTVQILSDGIYVSGGTGGGVTSVFGRTGVVVAQNGDYTTTQVTEGTNLYFTNLRAQTAMIGLSLALNQTNYLQ